MSKITNKINYERQSRETLIAIIESSEWQIKMLMGRIEPLEKVIKERDRLIERLRQMIKELEGKPRVRDRRPLHDWERELLGSSAWHPGRVRPPRHGYASGKWDRQTGEPLTRKQRKAARDATKPFRR